MKIDRYVTLLLLGLVLIFVPSCSKPPLTLDDTDEPDQTTTSLKITGDYTGCSLGACLHDGNVSTESISAFERLSSREVAVVIRFLDFESSFPTSECQTISAHGCVPMITWMPYRWSNTSDNTTYSLTRIISGDVDPYIRSFANNAKAYAKPLFIRWAHEMNGNWYNWSGAKNGNNAAAATKYINAWRHIYDVFQSCGAYNVTWVWCPNDSSFPNDTWNEQIDYFPGSLYTDWVGVDGYSSPWNGFSSFDSVFGASYSILCLYGKPIMIGETGRDEDTNKPSWIADAYYKIKNNYPNIKLVNWFNLNKQESDLSWRYWRIDTSIGALNAFKTAINNSHYISTIH